MLHGVHLLLPDPLLLTRRQLLAHFFVIAAATVAGHVVVCNCISAVVSAGCRREKCARSSSCLSDSFVLGAVECSIVLRVVSSSRAGSDAGDMRRVRSIAVLALHWLDCRVVEVDNQILVDRIFVRTF